MKTLSKFITESLGRTPNVIKNNLLKQMGVKSKWSRSGPGTYLHYTVVEPPIHRRGGGGYSSTPMTTKYYNAECDTFVFSRSSYCNAENFESGFIAYIDKLSYIPGVTFDILDNKQLDELGEKYTNAPAVVVTVPKDATIPSEQEQKEEAKKPQDEEGNKVDVEEENPTNNEQEDDKDEVTGYWCTGAGAERVTYLGYGAMTKSWKPNYSKIQKSIGERKFTMYYVKEPTKTFKSYKSLRRYLEKLHNSRYSSFHMASEEDLKQAAYDESYYIISV